MPSTIGWLAVAIAAGSVVGLMINHWSMVAGWLHRCLEDPVGRPRHTEREASMDGASPVDVVMARLDQRSST